jgi:hypothetical protein
MKNQNDKRARTTKPNANGKKRKDLVPTPRDFPVLGSEDGAKPATMILPSKTPAGYNSNFTRYSREQMAAIVERIAACKVAAPASYAQYMKKGSDGSVIVPILRSEPFTTTSLLEPIPVMYPASPSPQMMQQAAGNSLPPFLDLSSQASSQASFTALPTITATALPTLNASALPMIPAGFDINGLKSLSLTPSAVVDTAAPKVHNNNNQQHRRQQRPHQNQQHSRSTQRPSEKPQLLATRNNNNKKPTLDFAKVVTAQPSEDAVKRAQEAARKIQAARQAVKTVEPAAAKPEEADTKAKTQDKGANGRKKSTAGDKPKADGEKAGEKKKKAAPKPREAKPEVAAETAAAAAAAPSSRWSDLLKK